MGVMYQEGNNRKLRGENTFEGGLNQGASLFAVNDNETTEEYGFDTDNYPALTVRKGRTTYGSSGIAVTYLLTNYGNTHLVRAVGTTLQYWNGSAWTPIIGTFTAVDWDATNFNGKLILTNGTDNVKSWNGTTLSDLNVSDAPKGKYIANNTLRVFMAKDSTIYFSKYLDETNWSDPDSAGFFEYYTPNGGNVTALKLFTNTIIAFKKDAMAEIVGTGETTQKHRLLEISSSIGCVSFKTIQLINEQMYFLGERDVYIYNGGRPSPIGQKIRAYLNSINPAHVSKCCAFTDGLKYYLCLVTGSATEPNIRLVFDPRYGIWRVCALDENYRYGAFLNGFPYVGDSSGQAFKELDGTTNAGSPIAWSVTTKPFDEGMPEAEKTYLDLHIQGLFQTGTTLTSSVSTQDRGSSFQTINFDPTAFADYAQSFNCVIPLDTVPLTFKTRFRLTGTGPVQIERLQRYYRVQRVQR
ncbi:hypothetical protein [Paenibacillus contaminans]|uniref:Uncharacterized protein n=1 Tax=Paenibacillus contaminans TaxID=450362 RepID=A0A329MRL8_9BACL|nr:hypothetical protein [Paenibacillus contaminans]RAV22202.1 hypothetical protein DQG23_04420 [Paenibacillus contaminans]